MMKDIIDVVKHEIYSKLNLDVKIKEVVLIAPDVVEVIFCNFKWIKQNTYIVGQDGKNYFVESIFFTEIDGVLERVAKLVYQGSGFNPDDYVKGFKFTIPKPYFKDGTNLSVNVELADSSAFDLKSVMPLFWVHEDIRESVYPKGSPYERESSLTIFLLDEINYIEGNDDNRKRGVKPMITMFDEIIRVVDKSGVFERKVNTNFKTISRFGKETSEGIESYILDADLGGLKLDLVVDVNETKCNC